MQTYKTKDPVRQKTYDSYVRKYLAREYLFADGLPYKGSSDRTAFWNGYFGIKAAYAIYSHPSSIGYPAYRAGIDMAKQHPFE